MPEDAGSIPATSTAGVHETTPAVFMNPPNGGQRGSVGGSKHGIGLIGFWWGRALTRITSDATKVLQA